MKEHEKFKLTTLEKSNLSIASTITPLKLEKKNLRMQGLISHLHTLKTLLHQDTPIMVILMKILIFISSI